MPRLVDSEARRRDLAECALAIAESDGLEAVTVAHVARRAGVSVGHVQHWYPAKENLLVATYSAALARSTDRIDDLVTTGESRGATIRDMLAAALAELLPTDDTRRGEARVRAQFHGRAITDTRFADTERAAMRLLAQRIATALANGYECGETAAGVDPDRAACELLALATGLATLSLTDDHPAEELIAARLAELLPHPCRRP